EFPHDRLNYMTTRGFVTRSGNKLRLSSNFIKNKALIRNQDISGVSQFFGTPVAFSVNIRTLLEMRLNSVINSDKDLLKIVRRCVTHLPDDTGACLGGA